MRASLLKFSLVALAGLAGGAAFAGPAATPAVAALRPPAPPESFALLSGPAPDALLPRLTSRVASQFDSARGGWVSHGAPDEASVALAFALARGAAREAGVGALWRSRALATCDWTWALFDSVGGGFLQRIENTRSDNASFEKRTDSNAARLEHLIDAWHASGD